MPGAKWTQKDYQATAELIGKIALHQGNLWALTVIATRHCYENAKLDINGNRNFKPDKFVKECYKQAGVDGKNYESEAFRVLIKEALIGYGVF